MLRVYACIVQEHDFRLVVVAGIICLLAAFTAFTAFDRARAGGKRRHAWLALTAFVSGTGIWSTHFVAMLAYQPHLPIGYDLPLTLLSIAAAILITGAGWHMAMREERWAAGLGGAIAGSGIATMHYIGMSAVKVGGLWVWDETYVLVSVLIGIALSALALADHRRRPSLFPWRSAMLFTLAICGLHFTAMAAASIYPDPQFAVPAEAISGETLTVIVVAMAAIILSISFVMVLVDRKLARHAAEETQRLRAFADAAIEGLIVVDGEQVIDANRSFLDLSGYARRRDLPSRLGDLFPQLFPALAPAGENAKALECRLVRADGSICDVEVLLRPVSWRGLDRRVLAVRDISERKHAAARIAHLAYHDTLTGLPNRAVFNEHLARQVERAAMAGEPLAVLCLDLDGFKTINDLYGHPAADELLVAVALLLRSIRPRQRAGRPPRRRRVRHCPAGRQPAGPCQPAVGTDRRGAHPALRHCRRKRADQRQHRRRRLPRRRGEPERPRQECRSRTLPGQGGRARPHALLRGGDGRGAAPAPPARGGPAPGDRE